MFQEKENFFYTLYTKLYERKHIKYIVYLERTRMYTMYITWWRFFILPLPILCDLLLHLATVFRIQIRSISLLSVLFNSSLALSIIKNDWARLVSFTPLLDIVHDRKTHKNPKLFNQKFIQRTCKVKPAFYYGSFHNFLCLCSVLSLNHAHKPAEKTDVSLGRKTSKNIYHHKKISLKRQHI